MTDVCADTNLASLVLCGLTAAPTGLGGAHHVWLEPRGVAFSSSPYVSHLAVVEFDGHVRVLVEDVLA